jgi:hypothetical protein
VLWCCGAVVLVSVALYSDYDGPYHGHVSHTTNTYIYIIVANAFFIMGVVMAIFAFVAFDLYAARDPVIYFLYCYIIHHILVCIILYTL